MSNEDSSKDIGEGLKHVDDDTADVEDDEFDELDESLEKPESDKDNEQHHLKARRAIEEHLERTRLQKELNYLFDDDFSDDEDLDKQHQ